MAVNWENLPSTNTPLNATNLKSALRWTRLVSYQTASGNKTETIANITDYNEFMITLTPNGSPERVFACAVIPRDYFLATSDPGSGQHQIDASGNRSCGISYLGNNQVKLYTGTYSGIVLYAR